MVAQKIMPERRRFERATVLWSGNLVYGDQVVACVIVNIAAGGAMVRTDDTTICPASVTLHIPRIGDLAAEIRWRKNNEMGLKFLDDEQTVAALIGKALR